MRKTLNRIQVIPHKNDPEIGFKPLKRFILEYTRLHKEELSWLGVDLEDFQQDVFLNMIRRNGYPQYDRKKNRGSFRSYVFCNCSRHQIDLSRKRDTVIRQLSKATGGVKKHYMISLNQTISNKKGTQETELINIIYGSSLDCSRLEISYLINRLPANIISLDIPISQKYLSKYFLRGYTDKELSTFFSTPQKEIAELRKTIGTKLWSYYNE